MLRLVSGKKIEDYSADALHKLAAEYANVHIDIGTGDAKFLLKKSKVEPETLLIGLDAAQDSLKTGAQKAARKPSRGGAPNVRLFQANVLSEPLPELARIATSISVNFPWGDLLTACALPQHDALQKFALWAKPKAAFSAYLNLHTFQTEHLRTQFALPDVDEKFVADIMVPAYAKAGWHVENIQWLSAEDLQNHGSSWAGRLTKRSGRDTLFLAGVLNHGA